MLRTGAVYGLSCLDGPIMYVGATYEPLEVRLQWHWAAAKACLGPMQKWLLRFNCKSDLTLTVIDIVRDDDRASFSDRSLWRVEASQISRIAKETYELCGAVILNVPHNPFRQSIEGIRKSFAASHQFIAPELVSPYTFAGVASLSEAVR